MSVEGLWTIEFEVAGGWRNSGVVVLEKGRVFGGDGQYYYLGRFDADADGVLRAEVRVIHHHGPVITAFGDGATDFTVTLDGTWSGDAITGAMTRQGHRLGFRLTKRAPAGVSIDREGLFVAGQPFDALLAATRVLSTAQVSIVLVDGYISHQVLELMSAKAERVVVKIITKPGTLPGNIGALATAFNKQHGQKGPLSIRTSNIFHDRFLVIDDDQFYHFGASLKDLGARGSMFSRIEEPTIVAALRKSIADEWAKAVVVV